MSTTITTDIKGNDKFKYNDSLRIKYKTLIGFMESQNYYYHRRNKSTHVIYKNEYTGKTVPVPYKKGTIAQGTISRILKEMGLSRNDLAQYVHNKN